MATTQLTDIIVPELFSPYMQSLTAEKSRLISSGAVVENEVMSQQLSVAGGSKFNAPAMKDLVNEEENISSDEDAGVNDAAPKKTGAFNGEWVRLSRNQSWSSTDLTAALAGVDPMESIAQLVAGYWSRRLQAAFIATMNGVFADNDAAPAGSEHVQGDLTNDISGVSYAAGTTDFSANGFIDAAVTMGDSMGDLSMIAVHSLVYARMQKNNLIDFIPDARGEVNIPTFLGRVVIVDDGMPSPASGVYHTWLFGSGVASLGRSAPKVPTEVERNPAAGNGGGLEVLHSRVEWGIHPGGHTFKGTSTGGGPSNAATSGNLANAASWERVYPERKQVKIARLITREF